MNEPLVSKNLDWILTRNCDPIRGNPTGSCTTVGRL